MITDLYLNILLSFFVSQPKKKSRHELEEEKKAAEKALVQRETQLMDPSLRPEDAAAFERLLLASPNSSLLWLQYMAHHLQATQIEQARAVAERALKTISFRWPFFFFTKMKLLFYNYHQNASENLKLKVKII